MRSQVRAAARIVAALLLVGVLAGLVWALLVPAQHFLVVTPDGRGVSLTGESSHQFDAVALFVCIAAVVGLVSAVAAWQWRSARGPTLYAGLLLGSILGAAAMAGIGESVARLRYPAPDSPAVDSVVAISPGLGTLVVLIVQPLVASFVVLVIASINPLDDLGSSPRVPEESAAQRM